MSMSKQYWDYLLDEGDPVEVEYVPLPGEVLDGLRDSLKSNEVTNMAEILGGFTTL